METELKPDIKNRNRLGSISLEDSGNSDNLAIALCCYFERHMDRPADDQIDDEFGWGKWALKKTNEALDRIVAEYRPRPSNEGEEG